MKKALLLATLLAALAAPRAGQAAVTNLISSSDNIQTFVNNAGSNDVILLAPGTYTQDVSITNKAVSLIGVSGTVQFVGHLILKDIAVADGSAFFIRNLQVSSQAGTKSVTLNNVTNVVFSEITSTDSTFELFVTNSHVKVVNSTLQKIDSINGGRVDLQGVNITGRIAAVKNAHLTLRRCVVGDDVLFNSATTTGALYVVQSTVTNAIFSYAPINRVAYSTVDLVHCLKNQDAILVGNRSTTDNANDYKFIVNDGRAYVANNHIRNGIDNGGGISVTNCDALIANNYIHDCGYTTGATGVGIRIDNATTKPVLVLGNIIKNCYEGAVVGSSATLATVRFNNYNKAITGITAVGDNFDVAPTFTADYHLSNAAAGLNLV